jgi:hypothetical protein
VQSTHVFQILPSRDDPRSSSDEGSQDAWLTVSVRLYQAFLLMGGPAGRMASGDALLELEFDQSPDCDNLYF